MFECSRKTLLIIGGVSAVLIILSIVTSIHWFEKDEVRFERDVPDCIPIFNKANEMITETIKSSKLILKSPEAYRNISRKCQEAIECVKLNDENMASFNLHGKYNPCIFFKFYNGLFSTCADTLITKVGDQIPCIETVFNDRFTNKTEKCDAWKRSQPCLVRAIQNSCNKTLSSNKYYTRNIDNFTPTLCIDL